MGNDPMMRTLMSDAIDRKIKLRFLGTGVGRFSLRFTKASIPTRFSRSLRKYVRVSEAINWLKRKLNLSFADADVLHDDTRDLRKHPGKFDILLTSPPYLPAASGRESYSKARAPSLIALGMEDSESVNDLIDGAVGAMNNNDINKSSLTEKQLDLVEWLENDDLRHIKAAPTARYFQDMRKTFKQMRSLVKPGGAAIMVSGKQSTFYEFESREKLYVVESAELLANEANMSGFDVNSLQDVKLQKSNSNARPRSLDDYYETLIHLTNPKTDSMNQKSTPNKQLSSTANNDK
jgi:tRNA1(Val) A37 N6-methylase TrmN6